MEAWRHRRVGRRGARRRIGEPLGASANASGPAGRPRYDAPMPADAPATPAPRRARAAAVASVLGLVAMLAAACAPAPPAGAALADVRVITDDDPRWARRDVADDAWPRQPISAVDPDAPVWWLRGWVRIDAAALAAGRPLGMAVVALASCEAYWDGAPLGANGTVSAAAAGERPGRLAWLVALPADVTAGDHLVSLRCSAHHRGFEPSAGFYGVWIADYAALATVEIAYAAPTLISAGALITVGLFYLLTFLLARRRGARARDVSRHRSHLWLGTFAIAAGALVLAESARALVGYTYDVHVYRLIAIAALAWLVNVALLAFVTRRFALAGRRAVLAVGVTLATLGLAAPGFDRKVGLAFLVGLVLSLGWTAYALLRRRWHAGFAAAGLAGCLAAAAWRPGQFLDFYLFVMLGGLCLSLLVAHVLAEAHDDAQREALELRSARLEIELLRRQLQPHFLMNTLTALSEWFEAEPAVAAEMVEHVGRELRLLSEISRHTAVPLATELALCRSHLAVMARRRDEQLTLDAEGVDGAALIPPALFHTLTENALSHNAYRGRPAVFRLRQTAAPRPFAVRYTFDAPLVPRGRPREPDARGTGLRYIHARLRESYGEAYQLTSAAHDPGGAAPVWRTVIDLPGPPRAEA